MHKRVIKICFVFLSLLLIILVILFNVINYFHSLTYIETLISKGDKLINYSEKESDRIIYVRDNIKKVIYDNGDILYYDYNQNQLISIINELKRITISNISNGDGIQKTKYGNISSDEFHYKTIQKIKDINCIVIDLYNNNEQEFLLRRIWINEELGIIEKIASYSVKNGKEKLLNEEEYSYHSNDVTEEDIRKPDFNKYKNFNIVDNT